MTFTLTKNLTFSQAGTLIMAHFERAQARLYRQLMQRLKRVMKKPIVKAYLKLLSGVERMLKTIMRGLHGLEKTRLFKFLVWLVNALVLSVRKDGLIFTILLTLLGYTAWCYLI